VKKFIKIVAAVLAAVSVMAVAGCSARTPLTADSFEKLAKGQGFKVEAAAASDSSGTKSLTATKSESDTTITFTVFKDGSSAADQFSAQKKSVSPNGGGQSVDSATYSRYTVTNGELYYVIVRMDSTLLSCQAKVTNKDEADNLVKAAKY